MDKLSARNKILKEQEKLDEFAEAALMGILTRPRSSIVNIEEDVEQAYKYAEEMMSHRYLIIDKKAIKAGIAPVVE